VCGWVDRAADEELVAVSKMGSIMLSIVSGLVTVPIAVSKVRPMRYLAVESHTML
jgi:hypothetical protein